jgi:hypothetical protein
LPRNREGLELESRYGRVLLTDRLKGERFLIAPCIIDDLSREPPTAAIGTQWRLLTDQVMGGVSKGTMTREAVAGRAAIRMRGDVSLENNGGFVQIALDLSLGGKGIDASPRGGIELDVFGNGEEYGFHLRTDALTRPWQSYRQTFMAYPEWRTVQLQFGSFLPHRTEVPLDTHRLRRIGLIAIGRPFTSDIALAGVRFILINHFTENGFL